MSSEAGRNRIGPGEGRNSPKKVHFNDGAKTILCVLKELGIAPGTHCRDACAKLDHRRLSHLERKGSVEAKKRRKQLRNWKKKGYSETLEAREGPTYGAGAF